MSVYPNSPCLSRRFRLVHASFLEKDGLPFAEVLPAERVEEIFAEAGVDFASDEECVYTPAVTLWAFLSQALAKGELRSCMMAVSRVVVLLVALGREPCSKNTGAYCRARAKLPEVVIQSAFEAGVSPRELSFTTAMQTIVSSLELLAVLELAPSLDASFAARLVAAQLASLPQQTVGHRPDRVEPRAVKRRPKPHPLLTKPRHEARAELLGGAAQQA